MKSQATRRGANGRGVSVSHQAYPTIDPERVRQIIYRAPWKVVGLFNSAKARALVPWESQLERDCLRILEVDNSVLTYAIQPEVLHYEDGDKLRSYVPDIRVEHRDGTTEIIEVKAEVFAKKPETQALFSIARDAYAKRGIVYTVMTEREIRREPLLTNAKEMVGFSDYKPSKQLKLRVAELFNMRVPATLGELQDALGSAVEHRGDLYGMAIRGYFNIDLEGALLSDDSCITSDFRYSMMSGDD